MAANNAVSRITGCDLEPLVVLTPLLGIDTQPLVGLAEATRPLRTIIKDIDSYSLAAQDFADDLLLEGKDPYGLNSDEIAAINLYTQGWIPPENSLYAILNVRLRDRDREQVKPFFLYLRLFLSALEKLPKLTIPLYRGVKKDLSKDYKQGRKIYWWGFSSCTTSMAVLQSELFLGKTGARTMFCISKSSGVDIQRYSMYKAESEVLVPPGRRLQVAAILDQDSFQIVQLEEMGTEGTDSKDQPKEQSHSQRRYRLTPMKSWEISDLSNWLEDLQLGDYIVSFKKNLVDGSMLITLNEEDLKELGLVNKFHLKRLLIQRSAFLQQEEAKKKSGRRNDETR